MSRIAASETRYFLATTELNASTPASLAGSLNDKPPRCAVTCTKRGAVESGLRMSVAPAEAKGKAAFSAVHAMHAASANAPPSSGRRVNLSIDANLLVIFVLKDSRACVPKPRSLGTLRLPANYIAPQQIGREYTQNRTRVKSRSRFFGRMDCNNYMKVSNNISGSQHLPNLESVVPHCNILLDGLIAVGYNAIVQCSTHLKFKARAKSGPV